MKRNILNRFMALLTLGIFISLGACKQETKEKVEAAGDAVTEAAESAAEKVGESAEKAGEAVQQAVRDTKDAVVSGTNFNATGMVPCSMGSGSPSGNCDFGVVRRSGGDADVHVTKADGSKRVIYFQGGDAVGYDKSDGDAGALKASKESDLYIVQIGAERYEIPEAVIFGG